MWTLILAASAQQQICEPIGADVLAARIDQAALALAEVRLDDARSELLVAQEEARCLDAPIAPAQLAALAWLQAEYALFDQDADEAWRWVRLARDTASAVQPAPHVSGDHPLRRFLAGPAQSAELEGPDRAVAHPRRGGVYVDGVRLEVPRVRSETPHLVQVFVNKAWADAHWQQGARFQVELLADPIAVAQAEPEAVPDGPKRWKPARRDTVRAWEAWILANPDSEWLGLAQDRLDDRRFQDALADGEPALRAYLAATPGRNARAARAALERVDFDRAKEQDTRQAWSVFVGTHRGGVYLTEALARLDALTWEEMSARDTEEAYGRYLTQAPDGAHRDEARARMMERAWTATLADPNPAALTRFLGRFPRSPHAPEARLRLAGERFSAVQVAVDRCEPCAHALLARLETTGLRAELREAPASIADAQIPGETGLLWVRVTPGAEGVRWRARAELWSAVGGPLTVWTSEGADAAELAQALSVGLPDLNRWR